MANKKLYYIFADRGLDPNKPWDKSAVLALENQTWYGVQGFSGPGHFQSNTLDQPAGLPTGSATMTIAWGARWDGPPAVAGNPMLLRFGNGSNSGWLMQELPVSRRLGWILGNSVLLASHSMEPGINYTFAMTMQDGTCSCYVNGLPFVTSSGKVYGAPNVPTNPFLFGGSFNQSVPAINWTFNFFSISGDICMSDTEISGWDKNIRQFGPSALPSASNFWYAADLEATGSDEHITSTYWYDRIGNVGIERLSGSNLCLRTYTPTIPTGRWT